MKLSEQISAIANDEASRVAPDRCQIDLGLLGTWGLRARQLEAAAEHTGAERQDALDDLIFALMSASGDYSQTASELLDALRFAMRRQVGPAHERLREHLQRLADLQQSMDPS